MALEGNLSPQSAFGRFVCGATMTAYGIGRIAKDKGGFRGQAMILFGAMKMAEGVLKYCPAKAAMNGAMNGA